jgi:DNA-binding CsgD family transcriptional regulator
VPVLDERLQRLLPRIYEVNHGSDSWAPLLDEIGHCLGGKAVALISHDFSHNQGFIYAASGYDQNSLESYTLHHARHNVWLAQERDYRVPGKVHLGEDVVPESELIRTDFYSNWLHPQDLHHRLCAVLSRARRTAVFLEVMRPRGWGRFEHTDIERCRLLLPHLQRVLRMHHRLAELEIERNAAFDALDHLPWGVVLVDQQGNRLVANRRAQEILMAGDGLMANGDGLRAELCDETARLDRLLGSALKAAGGQASSAGGTLSITRPSGAHPLSVLVVPLRTKAETLGDRVPAAAIFLNDPDMRTDSNEQHLRELYALTVVEARLAAWLSRGKSVEEAARAMGVTVNTARAYLKRIYNKTGVRRQSELVRLLLLALPG